MTSIDFRLMDASSRLQGDIEANLETTGYILAGKNARYHLKKYKVLEFNEGNRMARITIMGISDSTKAQLRVKAALYNNGDIARYLGNRLMGIRRNHRRLRKQSL